MIHTHIIVYNYNTYTRICTMYTYIYIYIYKYKLLYPKTMRRRDFFPSRPENGYEQCQKLQNKGVHTVDGRNRPVDILNLPIFVRFS